MGWLLRSLAAAILLIESSAAKQHAQEQERRSASLPQRATRHLPPIPCREDLAVVAETRFRQIGRAVEVGVYRGFFAKHNLQSWQGEYHLVDYVRHRLLNQAPVFTLRSDAWCSRLARSCGAVGHTAQ